MRRKNNKGLTLIELIVSIAILAIIVLPLMTAFVVSLRTNAKAKEKLRAIDIAHNFMEGMEAESVTDVISQLAYDDTFNLLANKGSLKSVEVVKREGKFASAIRLEDIPAEVENKDALITSSVTKDKSGNFVVKTNDSKKYYFYVNQIPSDGKVFDALVTIDGNMKSDSADPSGKSIPKYNTEVSVADMERTNLAYDAVNTKVKTVQNVIEDLHTAKGMNLLEDDVNKYMKRTTTITIGRPTSNPKSAKVTVSYVYELFDGCPKRDDMGNQLVDEDGNLLTEGALTFPEAGSSYESEYSEVVFDNTDTVDVKDTYLKNVYFYFMPWYASTQTDPTNRTEQIVIDNTANIDCTIKLIKQQAVEDSQLNTAEMAYRAVVNLRESLGTDEKPHAKIETNLNTNLAVVRDDSDNFENNFMGSQTSFLLNGSEILNWKNDVYDPADQKHIHSNGNPKDYKMWISTGFGMKETRARLYEVSVEVFPAGTGIEAACEKTAQPIVTLTGGLTD